MPSLPGRDPQIFNRLVEHSLDVFLVLDAAGIVRYLSPAVGGVLGYRAEDLLGRPILDPVHPDDVERIARYLAVRVAIPGRAPPVELRFAHHAGGWRVLEVVASNLLGDPDVGAVVLNARDITELHEARQAVRAAEERYGACIEQSLDGMFRLELSAPVPTSLPADQQIGQWYEHARLAEGNRALARMLGRAGPAQLIGARLADVLPPEEPTNWAALRAFIEGGYVLTDVTVATGGEESSAQVTLAGVVDGGLLTRIWGVRRPTSDREPAAGSAGRSDTLLEQVPAVMWTTDADLLFTSVTGAGLPPGLGLTAPDLLGEPIAKVFTDASGPAVVERHRAALRGDPRVQEIEWAGRLYSLHVQPLLRADGSAGGTVGIALDVTEERHHGNQLHESRKMDAVGQLTGGLAHDFNNLLTVILTNAELVSAALSPDAKDAKADLEEIRLAAQRGGDMIKKLLGFGRRDMLTLRPLRIADAFDRSAEALRTLIEPDVTLEIEPADPDLVVRADDTAVQQILENLAMNARDAMPGGGTLTLRARRVGESGKAAAMAEIEVVDTGEGMSREVLDRALEPFFTTKPPGEGSGLGLAMIYGLVMQHGGSVALQSEPGVGTSAFVRLPLMSTGAVVSENGGGAVEPAFNGSVAGTILVAEDEAAIRSAARRLLERYGYHVVEAVDGAEALEWFHAHESDVDLIICDVIMPRLGGREVLDALRRRGKSVPFLLMSGHTGRGGDAVDALEPGIPFLPKPWTAEDLLTHVRQLLDTPRDK